MQEQRLIAQRVAELIANIIATVERSRREIELLREFRTSLISDVVTGKFDVRHVAARLPEEVEDFGAHDELDMIPDIDEEHPAAVGAAIEEAKA
jgi:type I restriction enzyme S subunit